MGFPASHFSPWRVSSDSSPWLSYSEHARLQIPASGVARDGKNERKSQSQRRRVRGISIRASGRETQSENSGQVSFRHEKSFRIRKDLHLRIRSLHFPRAIIATMALIIVSPIARAQ